MEPWLLTPLTAPNTPSEAAYNNAHMKTRCVIEQCFGLLKSRFRCLDKSGGTLLYTPDKVCRFVTATAVLHNFCVQRNIPATMDDGVVSRSAAVQPATICATTAAAPTTAEAIRRRLIEQF